MNAPERQALTVTELNTLAKEYLENLPLFRSVSVKGELSNVTLHRTGHIYFSIKDEGAAVSAVMWRSDAASLGFTPENGQKVTGRGEGDALGAARAVHLQRPHNAEGRARATCSPRSRRSSESWPPRGCSTRRARSRCRSTRARSASSPRRRGPPSAI